MLSSAIMICRILGLNAVHWDTSQLGSSIAVSGIFTHHDMTVVARSNGNRATEERQMCQINVSERAFLFRQWHSADVKLRRCCSLSL